MSQEERPIISALEKRPIISFILSLLERHKPPPPPPPPTPSAPTAPAPAPPSPSGVFAHPPPAPAPPPTPTPAVSPPTPVPPTPPPTPTPSRAPPTPPPPSTPTLAFFVCSRTPAPAPYTGKEPVYSFEYEGKTYYTLYQAGVPVRAIGNPSYAVLDWRELKPGYWNGKPTNATLGELAEPCSSAPPTGIVSHRPPPVVVRPSPPPPHPPPTVVVRPSPPPPHLPTPSHCSFPVATSSPADCILQAFMASGYYGQLSPGDQAAARANPSGWLASHPYLYSRYPNYFARTPGISPHPVAPGVAPAPAPGAAPRRPYVE